MGQSDILKGNYKIPDLEDRINMPEDMKKMSLGEEFEAAALKKLGGSITFVKKPGSFVWKGEDKKSG